jgi:hypothetical protein
MLIAMIHRAEQGWYRGNGVDIAHDIQMDTSNVAAGIRRLEQFGLITPAPDNKPRGNLRAWRIDPKFIVGNQNGKSELDGGRGREAANVVDRGTVSGGNRAADFPAEEQRHQQKPSPAP